MDTQVTQEERGALLNHKTGKWVKKWDVPSSSSGKTWRVSITDDGTWGCSCPVWKFKRQECHHIKIVKMGGGTECMNGKTVEKPEYILAAVDKPVFDEAKNELLVPLVGIPDANMMEATICYYMLKYGYSMKEVRKIRRIPSQWTGKAIFAHIERHGEAKYPEGWYRH